MVEDKNTRIERLNESARARAERTRAAAQRAITALDARGKEISFTAIAAEAGVSVSYLYKDEDIAERIRELRKSSARRAQRRRVDQTPGERSLTTKLHAALDRIEQLEKENGQLRKENRSLLSRLMDAP